MSERAEGRSPEDAAAEAVKAYIRLNREELAADGELIAQLLPDRFAGSPVRDLQQVVIEKLRRENASLRAERDALRSAQDANRRLDEAIRQAVLELLDARNFAEVIAIGLAAASSFGADKAAFCVESEEGGQRISTTGLRLLPSGAINALLGSDGMGAVLGAGGAALLGSTGARCASTVAFRLRIGSDAPLALYVLGAETPGRFENEDAESRMRYFARALERAIRAWLDLPKI